MTLVDLELLSCLSDRKPKKNFCPSRLGYLLGLQVLRVWVEHIRLQPGYLTSRLSSHHTSMRDHSIHVLREKRFCAAVALRCVLCAAAALGYVLCAAAAPRFVLREATAPRSAWLPHDMVVCSYCTSFNL